MLPQPFKYRISPGGRPAAGPGAGALMAPADARVSGVKELKPPASNVAVRRMVNRICGDEETLYDDGKSAIWRYRGGRYGFRPLCAASRDTGDGADRDLRQNAVPEKRSRRSTPCPDSRGTRSCSTAAWRMRSSSRRPVSGASLVTEIWPRIAARDGSPVGVRAVPGTTAVIPGTVYWISGIMPATSRYRRTSALSAA